MSAARFARLGSRSAQVASALGLALAVACGGGDGVTERELTDRPGVPCRTADDCSELRLTPCQLASCDAETRRCAVSPVLDDTPCSTQNPCMEGERCFRGTCGGGRVVAPACGERECGPDACGNACGSCGAGDACTTEGRCEPDTSDPCMGITFDGCCRADGATVWCDGGALVEVACPSASPAEPRCGWVTSEAYYFCTDGQEAPSPDPAFPYLCPGESCPPDPCAGRECGFACGQPCGTCPDASDRCTPEGSCAPDACGELTLVGCCDGTLSVWCQDDEVRTQDCASDVPPACGWDVSEGWYDCGFTEGDPTGVHPRSCDALHVPGLSTR